MEDLFMLEPLSKRLKNESRPILLYGMGNGAEKIYAWLQSLSITISGIFASEGYVRGQNFLNYPVLSLAEAEKKFGDFAAVLCFGIQGQDAYTLLQNLSTRHTVYSPNLPVYGEGAFTDEYIRENKTALSNLYIHLEDQLSKDILRSILSYSYTGKWEYLMEARSGWHLPNNFFQHNHRHIDIGGFDGDTVLWYYNQNQNYSDIVAFEPDRINFSRMQKRTAALRNVICENSAVGEKSGTIEFNMNGGRSGAAESGGKLITCVSLDDYCNQPNIIANGVRVGSIKIDAEGQDREVLYGAANILHKNQPDLMIATYHRLGDLLYIPHLLRYYHPGYKLYLRKLDYVPAWDIFYFATR